MRIQIRFLCLIVLAFSINYGAEGVLEKERLPALKSSVFFKVETRPITTKEISNLMELSEYANREGRGLFLFDADEVLFTQEYDEASDKVCTVRLYSDLEGLIEGIKSRGHAVVIITYNFESAVKDGLKKIGLDEGLFDQILACELKGDAMTAKGRLLKTFIAESGDSFKFGVFVDNFPPFVENVKQAARECGFELYAFIFTGYLNKYYCYVYHRLSKLCEDQLADKEGVEGRVAHIAEGLSKYNIKIESFKRDYSDINAFQESVKGLIWPYLTLR